MSFGYARYVSLCGLLLCFFLPAVQAQDNDTAVPSPNPAAADGSQQVPSSEAKPAAVVMPPHVTAAIAAIDVCHHWSGELDGYADEERMRRIKNGFDRDCPTAAKLAKKAYKKSPSHPLLAAKILLLIDSRYYQVSDREKRKICSKAKVVMKDKSAEMWDSRAYYQIVCRN